MAITINGSGITSANIADGTITNSDINASAAITASKLSGTGKVLQVVSAMTNSSIGTTSTSYVATGFYVDITPTATTSKILVTLSGGSTYNGVSASTTQFVTIYRDSTNLGHSSYGLSRFSTPGGYWSLVPHSASVLDTPSSTSVLRYQIYFKNSNTASNVDFSHFDRGYVTITAMEIGA